MFFEGAKNVLLWKFILEQLRSGTESVRWVNLKTGTFRFVDTTDISRKWGEKKRKSDMNFEKLSRGIRHVIFSRHQTLKWLFVL